jgi:hypothetical protein
VAGPLDLTVGNTLPEDWLDTIASNVLYLGNRAVVEMVNRSGVSLATGDVVVFDTANDASITRTTTADDKNAVGVVIDGPVANLATARVVVRGLASVSVNATTSRGDRISTSTTAGQGKPSATPGADDFAVATAARVGAGLVECYVIGKPIGIQRFTRAIQVNATGSTFSAGTDAETVVNIGSGGAAPTANRTAALLLNAPSGGSGIGDAQVLFLRAGINKWAISYDSTGVGGASTATTDLKLYSYDTGYVFGISITGLLTTIGGFSMDGGSAATRAKIAPTGTGQYSGLAFATTTVTLATSAIASDGSSTVVNAPGAAGALNLRVNNVDRMTITSGGHGHMLTAGAYFRVNGASLNSITNYETVGFNVFHDGSAWQRNQAGTTGSAWLIQRQDNTGHLAFMSVASGTGTGSLATRVTLPVGGGLGVNETGGTHTIQATAMSQAAALFTGGSGQWCTRITNINSASSSYGLLVQAGTNTSDYSAVFQNAAGNVNLANIDGGGNFVLYGRVCLNQAGSATNTSALDFSSSVLLHGIGSTWTEHRFYLSAAQRFTMDATGFTIHNGVLTVAAGGATPATAGSVRLPHDGTIYARNQGNSADIIVAWKYYNGAASQDVVQIGSEFIHLKSNVVVSGASTGTYYGAGTINVTSNVYKNGNPYTNPDFIFELAYTGRVKRYVNEGWAHYQRMMGGSLWSLDAIRDYVERHWRFPIIDGLDAGMFTDQRNIGRDDVALILSEQTYLFLFDHEDRIKTLERRPGPWLRLWSSDQGQAPMVPARALEIVTSASIVTDGAEVGLAGQVDPIIGSGHGPTATAIAWAAIQALQEQLARATATIHGLTETVAALRSQKP